MRTPAQAVQKAQAPKRAQKNTATGTLRNNLRHYDLWGMVKEFMEAFPDKSWDEAFKAAAEQLAGTRAQASKHTVEASYKRVEKSIREGGGLEYYQPQNIKLG